MYRYIPYNSSLYHMQPLAPLSYIRILHASPDAPAVDIYANGNLIAQGLTYKEFTDYLQVNPGRYNIQVFPAGQQMNPVINTDITIPQNNAYTIAAVGRLSSIGLLPIPEIYMPETQMRMPNNSNVRFVHLSPNAPAVDITLPDGTKLFENVPYKKIYRLY